MGLTVQWSAFSYTTYPWMLPRIISMRLWVLHRELISANQIRLIQSGATVSIFFNWKNSWPSISVFESSIRYIGGLLSAYELSGKQHRTLVTKAAQLADKLIFAWVGVCQPPLIYHLVCRWQFSGQWCSIWATWFQQQHACQSEC